VGRFGEQSKFFSERERVVVVAAVKWRGRKRKTL
jgi:hypothetical protein